MHSLHPGGRWSAVALVSVVTLTASSLSLPGGAAAVTPPVVHPGMTDSVVLDDLPGLAVAFEFEPSGGVLVASKSGVVRRYRADGSGEPSTVIDLTREVFNSSDFGLLGLALDPGYAAGRPYIYLLFQRDRDPFGTDAEPRWSGGGVYDECPSPPGGDGCTTTASLVRYTIGADGRADPASARVLLDGAEAGGWCFQSTSHGIGSVVFGPDGMLYVSSGDGSSFSALDYGQIGGSAGSPTPVNPCNDGPTGRGVAPSPADSRGGALRSQAVRAASGADRVPWNGAVLRVDPETGLAPANNPLVGNGIVEDDRIVAYGLRNPYRMSFRPGTDELWLGDVGLGSNEEIDAFRTGPEQTEVPNFGWPCREGTVPQDAFASAGLGLCRSLLANDGVSDLGGVRSPLVDPTFSWPRAGEQPAPGCPAVGGGAATGGVFVDNDAWPEAIARSYVFGDYARGCVAVIPVDADGRLDVEHRHALVSGGTAPVQFRVGPGGDVYFLDLASSQLRRIRPVAANVAPVAVLDASARSGDVPLTVVLDASRSSDGNPGERLLFTWDLDGDGSCDDATGVRVEHTFTVRGDVDVALCVRDGLGAEGRVLQRIAVGESPPTITELTGPGADGVAVGDQVTLRAEASDAQDGALPDSAFTWSVDLRHCPDEAIDDDAACHTHPYVVPAPGRSATVTVPDHDYYAFLRVHLTVTDSHGLGAQRSIDIRPRVSTVTLRTPQGPVTGVLGTTGGETPLTQKFLEGSTVQLILPDTVAMNGVDLQFREWRDDPDAAATRTVTAAPGASEYLARYATRDPYAAFRAWWLWLLARMGRA